LKPGITILQSLVLMLLAIMPSQPLLLSKLIDLSIKIHREKNTDTTSFSIFQNNRLTAGYFFNIQ